MSQNKTNELRVFISSTFRDLQEEREHLIKKIFPKIRALCRERGVTFTDIDLRWGLTEEQASLGTVIRTCLEEIDKCRPYFIGMIGGRYGWVPELHEIMIDPELLSRYPWIEDATIEGASVTEMEFVHGVFNAQNVEDSTGQINGQCAYFYHRDSDLTQADDSDRLQALIDRARATRYPFREFGDIETLGRMVHDDLLEMFEKNWPESEAPPKLELERRAHRAFAASRKRAYIPNPEYLKQFGEWLVRQQLLPLVITAPSGLGKSSLVAYLVDYYRKRHPTALVIEYYIGASSASGSATAVMRHIVEEICECFGIDEELPTKSGELEKNFSSWLFRAEHLASQVGIPILIAVDALNQLDESGQRLAWLPKTIPSGMRLMISTTPGECTERLSDRERFGLEVAKIEDERIRQSILLRYLGEFHKGITPDQVRRVTSGAKGSSPLYLRVVGEELRLHGEHETLDRVIKRYVEAEDLAEVFDRVLERMESDFGVVLVRDLMSMIWASRAGLSETEVQDLTGIGRLELSRLLFALDYHLIQHQGLIGFFHDYLRQAVEKRYLPDVKGQRLLHQQLAEYFEHADINSRSGTEIIYQYRRAGLWQQLAQAMSQLDRFMLLWSGGIIYEVLGNWHKLGEQGIDIEVSYRESMATWIPEQRMSRLLCVEALAEMYNDLGHLEASAQLYSELISLAREFGDMAHCADAHKGLGKVRNRQARYEDAMNEFRTAEPMYEKLGDRRGLIAVNNGIGNVYIFRGEFDSALEYYTRQEVLCQEIGDQHGSASVVHNIGMIYRAQGKLSEALHRFEQAMAMNKSIGNQHWVVKNMSGIGGVLISRKEQEKALHCFNQIMLICRDIGDRVGVAGAMRDLGNIYCEMHQYDRALECLKQAAVLHQEIGNRRGEIDTIGYMGHVYCRMKEFENALDSYHQAIVGAREIGNVSVAPDLLAGRASLLLNLAIESDTMPEYLPACFPTLTESNWRTVALDQAYTDATDSIVISEELSSTDTSFTGNILLARIDSARGNTAMALQCLLAILENADNDVSRAEVCYWLWKIGEVEQRTQDSGHREEALLLYTELYAKVPKHEYKERIDELEAAVGE